MLQEGKSRVEVTMDAYERYNEALANDFVLSDGGSSVELLGSHIADWRITLAAVLAHGFIDTVGIAALYLGWAD